MRSNSVSLRLASCVDEVSSLRLAVQILKRAPVAIGLGFAVVVNPPCRIVQVIVISPTVSTEAGR